MAILCGVDERTAAALAASGRQVWAIPGLSGLREVLRDSDDRVLVLGTAVPRAEAFHVAAQLQIDRPQVAILLLNEDGDADPVDAVRVAGIRETVPAADVEQIGAAIERAETAAREGSIDSQASEPQSTEHVDVARPRGRIITVFAAKGGCGKTTLATNLAAVLNADGHHTVCLVDLDLDFGDIAVSLQLRPATTLADVSALDRVDASNVASLLTNYRPGFDCALAPVEPGDAEKVPVERISELLEVLVDTHEFVVVDTPSQLSEHVLAAMDLSHNFLLLTTPEIPALKNLRLTLDMLDLLSYNPEARAIVFNRADARAGLSAADVESTLKQPISSRIPSSHDVPASINRGVPLALSGPKHPVTTAIRELAESYIIGGALVAEKRSGRHSLRLRMRSS